MEEVKEQGPAEAAQTWFGRGALLGGLMIWVLTLLDMPWWGCLIIGFVLGKFASGIIDSHFRINSLRDKGDGSGISAG